MSATITAPVNVITGQHLVALGNTKVGETYIFGSLVPKNNPTWHGPWDCAEFASWLVYQTTQKLYGCHNNTGNPAIADAYTGYFDRDAHSTGHIISINKAAATTGAFIFRIATPDLPGHIVVSDGRGGTVEAHSHADGVINGQIANRRWDYGILIPWIDYEDANPINVVVPHATVYRLTNPPMISDKVGEIQQALINAGFDPKGIDNSYGRDTAKAIIAFQEAKGLVVDGEVGEQTARLLGIA